MVIRKQKSYSEEEILDSLLEKAFCEGYLYAQKVYGESWDKLKDHVNNALEGAKAGFNTAGKFAKDTASAMGQGVRKGAQAFGKFWDNNVIEPLNYTLKTASNLRRDLEDHYSRGPLESNSNYTHPLRMDGSSQENNQPQDSLWRVNSADNKAYKRN